MLILSVREGQPPAVVHWGRNLPGVDPAQLELMATRQWVFGGPQIDLQPSLALEMGLGLNGPAGLSLHRQGRDWAPVFLTEACEVENHRAHIIAADANLGIRIEYTFALDPAAEVLSVNVSLRNEHTEPLSLEQMAVMAMPLDQDFDRLKEFSGRWSGEFETDDVTFHSGSYLRENKSGRTSHDCFPGVIALTPCTNEQAGDCVGFHLAWSGNSRIRVDRHHDGRSYASLGEFFFPGEMIVGGGETYVSPTLHAAYSSNGLNELSAKFHHFVGSSLLDARTADKPRPVHYNTWEAVYFDHSDERLLELARRAADVGAERFVLDDGWFGGRRGDAAGLGDWWVSADVYPQGLRPLADEVRRLGMELGIWFEPEMVNPDSDLFRAHPDWVLTVPGVEPVPFRNQLTLDLTKPEVSEYLFNAIDSVVTDLSLDYIKWDMNRDNLHPGGPRGEASAHAQTYAVYDLIARLRSKHPNLEIESCASGGGRVDMGILKHTDRVWTSDNNDALDRQRIQRGASYFFPLRVLGSHVGPRKCHITGRELSMEFRVASALFGHMGVEADLALETEDDLQTLKEGIALYKEHRKLLHGGRFVRLETPDYLNAVGVVAKDGSEGLFSCATLRAHQETHPPRLRFPELRPDASYRLRLIWPRMNPSITAPSLLDEADLMGEGTIVRGSVLKHFGMQLPVIHPETALIYHVKMASDDR